APVARARAACRGASGASRARRRRRSGACRSTRARRRDRRRLHGRLRRDAARAASARPRAQAPARSPRSGSPRSGRGSAPPRSRALRSAAASCWPPGPRVRESIIGPVPRQPYGPGGPSSAELRPRLPAATVAAVRVRVVAAALLVALVTPAAAAASLPASLERALHVPHVSLARTGAVAIDLATGQTIYARNASLSLLPASNEKLTVTYAALTALGPGFTIETDVLGEGQQVGSAWQG